MSIVAMPPSAESRIHCRGVVETDHGHVVLCDDPTTVRVIGAMVLTGDVTAPEVDVLRRRCAALSPDERRRHRDKAMARLLRSAILAKSERLALPKSR